jgi:hypothetical protein
VDDVADADELRIQCESRELFVETIGAQVHPAHDAFDERVPSGQFQEKGSILHGLAGLHSDAAVEPSGPKQRFELGRQVIALQDPHPFGDPRIAGSLVVPEVLMGVDSHRNRA